MLSNRLNQNVKNVSHFRFIFELCLLTGNLPKLFSAKWKRNLGRNLVAALIGAVHKLCRLGRGEGGSPKDDLVHRPYFIKKALSGGRGSDIVAIHNLT